MIDYLVYFLILRCIWCLLTNIKHTTLKPMNIKNKFPNGTVGSEGLLELIVNVTVSEIVLLFSSKKIII